MTPTPETFFHIRDVADALDVSTRTVRRWIDRRLLRVHRFGRLVRVSNNNLKSFLAKRDAEYEARTTLANDTRKRLVSATRGEVRENSSGR